MSVDIEAITAALANEDATKRPWTVQYDRQPTNDLTRVMRVDGPPRTEDYGMGPEQVRDKVIETDGGYYPPRKPDADLICLAVNNLEALVEVHRAANRVSREWLGPHAGALTVTSEMYDALNKLSAAIDRTRKP